MIIISRVRVALPGRDGCLPVGDDGDARAVPLDEREEVFEEKPDGR